MQENDAGKTLDMLPCWMDDAKSGGGMYWSGIYHYVDIPFIDDKDWNGSVTIQANASGALVLSDVFTDAQL